MINHKIKEGNLPIDDDYAFSFSKGRWLHTVKVFIVQLWSTYARL